MKIWFLKFPTYIYKENVKDLARKAGVKIVDEKYVKSYPDEARAEKVPKVTVKPEYAPKAEA